MNPAWIPITCTALFKAAYNSNSKGAVTSFLFCRHLYSQVQTHTQTHTYTQYIKTYETLKRADVNSDSISWCTIVDGWNSQSPFCRRRVTINGCWKRRRNFSSPKTSFPISFPYPGGTNIHVFKQIYMKATVNRLNRVFFVSMYLIIIKGEDNMNLNETMTLGRSCLGRWMEML